MFVIALARHQTLLRAAQVDLDGTQSDALGIPHRRRGSVGLEGAILQQRSAGWNLNNARRLLSLVATGPISRIS